MGGGDYQPPVVKNPGNWIKFHPNEVAEESCELTVITA
jgi:hypothetical protein